MNIYIYNLFVPFNSFSTLKFPKYYFCKSCLLNFKSEHLAISLHRNVFLYKSFFLSPKNYYLFFKTNENLCNK